MMNESPQALLGDMEMRFVSACCDADVATPCIGVFICEACGRRLMVTGDERPVAGETHLSWLRYPIEDAGRTTQSFVDLTLLPPCDMTGVG